MNIQDISKDLLASVSSIIEKKSVKEVDEPRSKGEKDFKDLHTKNVKVHTEKKTNECKSEKDFKPHMMYDPKTGKGYEAKTYDDHVRMDKMGYTHDKPEVKEIDEPTAKGEKDFKDLHTKNVEVHEGADKDVKGDKEAYQKFFQGMLKKFGVKSPASLPADKEKEFYDAIDAGWKADNEKKESIEEMKEPFIVIDTADKNKVVGTASDEKGAERIIASAERPPISIKDKKTLKVVKSSKKQNVGFPMKEMKSATGYEIYHKDFSSAMQHAYDFAKKKLKVEVDPKEIDREVAMGPKRPSKGKENSYRLKGKGGAIQVQVYNTGKSYELNMYKESVKEETLEERAKSMDPKKSLKIFNELKKGNKIGIAYDTPMAKADIYKDGELVYREFTVTRNKTVVGKERVEKITLAKDNVKSGVKFFLYNRGGKVSMAIGNLAAVIIDMKKM